MECDCGCDFSGWATRAETECSDGRTIAKRAFAHQDQSEVPLVWQHGHKDPTNVLGRVRLEDRDEGVYSHAFFNNTPKAVHSKEAVGHGDIKYLSIWANQLLERAGNVLHGKIREVSLVLSGANPGALIENINIAHADGGSEIVEDEAIIHTGFEISLSHAEGDEGAPENTDSNTQDDTVREVYESMTDAQKEVLHYMVAKAAEDTNDNGDGNTDGGDAVQSNTDNNDDALEHGSKDGTDVGKRNIFENGEGGKTGTAVISHSDMEEIFATAKKKGSLREVVEAYAEEHLEHGITDIDTLFPEATALTAAPEFFGRRTEWVNGVLSGARKTPFSRIKTHWADLTFDEARAKGYIKGTLKKEEFFGTARRTTTPTTVYKKQALDRDDVLDITDFDVVVWMKGEMRLMLDEELARAILIGDGRALDDEDLIPRTNIRPIATDDDLFTVKVYVNLDDASSSVQEVVDAIVMNRQYYRGSGQPTMYTTESFIAQVLLLKDGVGRRIYTSLDQLATELRVSSIVAVEVMETETDLVAILVNMTDYTIGADRGGQVTMFEDFDIDYNKQKYLIETRISGCLTKLRSAIAITKVDSGDVLVTPQVPTFNSSTGVITIPSQTGVDYENAAGDPLTPGAQAPLAAGASLTVVAVPESGYFFSSSEGDTWTFKRQDA